MVIAKLDSNGNPLETWTLWNAFLTEVKFGDLEYGADDLSEMSLTIKYDWARVETTNVSSAVNAGGDSFFNV